MQTRIRNLHWITAPMLDATIDDSKPLVTDFTDKAITGGMKLLHRSYGLNFISYFIFRTFDCRIPPIFSL